MNKEQGFILALTLLMITVISLLLLTSLQHILLFHQVINRQEQAHKKFYNLEHVARQLAQKYIQSSVTGCVIGERSPQHVLQQLLLHQGCALMNEGLQYAYLIEDLGEFPCLIAYNKSQKRVTHHQRISVVQLENDTPLSFLQIRWITVGAVANCLLKERPIPLGISSWSYRAMV